MFLLYNNKMRKSEKVKAIVIKSRTSGEKDKILKLLSSDGRIINAVSKGAVGSRNKNRAGSMLFCLSDFVLTYTGDMAYVSDSEVIKPFRGLGQDIVKMSCASYICEASSFLEMADISDDTLYRLLGHTLTILEKIPEEYAVLLAVTFMLKLSGIMGIAPEFDKCVHCGEESEYYFFTSQYGGTICPVCVPAMSDETVLSKDEARYLKLLMYIDIRKIPSLTCPDTSITLKLLGCVNGYLGEYFHKKNNSYDMFIDLFNI